jgi:DNA-binding NarL/FixJ family response regulator
MKQPTPNQIRVAVADPSPVVLSGFARIFESTERIELVGCVSNLQLLEELLQHDPPQVSIVDWALLRGDANRTPHFMRGISATTRVLVSGMSSSLRDFKRAFELGAKGILTRGSSSDQVRKAVQRVAAGGIWIKKNFADALLQATFIDGGADASVESRIRSLTARERQVVECVCRGMKSKEVALQLQISENTVSHHLSSIFAKLHVKDRVGLVNFAYCNEMHVSHALKVKQFPNPEAKPRTVPPSNPNVDPLASVLGRINRPSLPPIDPAR